MKMTPDQRYDGGPAADALLFKLGEWIALQEHLVCVDVVMQMLARSYQLRLVRDIRHEWPSRGLHSSGFKRFELRVMLNPTYLEDREVYFVIDEQWLFELPLYVKKVLRRRNIGRYSVAQVKDVALMSTVLDDALLRNLPQRGRRESRD